MGDNNEKAKEEKEQGQIQSRLSNETSPRFLPQFTLSRLLISVTMLSAAIAFAVTFPAVTRLLIPYAPAITVIVVACHFSGQRSGTFSGQRSVTLTVVGGGALLGWLVLWFVLPSDRWSFQSTFWELLIKDYATVVLTAGFAFVVAVLEWTIISASGRLSGIKVNDAAKSSDTAWVSAEPSPAFKTLVGCITLPIAALAGGVLGIISYITVGGLIESTETIQAAYSTGPVLSYGQEFVLMTPLAGLYGATVGMSLALCPFVGSLRAAAALVSSTLIISIEVLYLWQRSGRDFSEIVLYAPFLVAAGVSLTLALIFVTWAAIRHWNVGRRPKISSAA